MVVTKPAPVCNKVVKYLQTRIILQMVHVVESHGGPDRGADERGHPPNQKVHAVVGVGVGEEHVDHQDVVQVKALFQRIINHIT